MLCSIGGEDVVVTRHPGPAACVACGSPILLPSVQEPGIVICGVCGAQLRPGRHGHVHVAWNTRLPQARLAPHERIGGRVQSVVPQQRIRGRI